MNQTCRRGGRRGSCRARKSDKGAKGGKVVSSSVYVQAQGKTDHGRLALSRAGRARGPVLRTSWGSLGKLPEEQCVSDTVEKGSRRSRLP